jgi:hypothetical protein
MPEARILISEATLTRLHELAHWAGVSVNEALDEAVRDRYDRQFWEAVNAGYAALRADPAAWAEVEAERKPWERTLLDGLGPAEDQKEDRDTTPSTGQGLPS